MQNLKFKQEKHKGSYGREINKKKIIFCRNTKKDR
jgi:hypothetical protein